MNQKLKNALLIILIFSVTIFLAYTLAPLGGSLHSSITGDRCSGGLFLLESGDGCVIEGFIYFYIFWLAILVFSILKQKIAWGVFIIGSAIFWIASIHMIITEDLSYRLGIDISTLVIMLVVFALGYGLAFGIRKLIKIKTTT